MMPFTFEEFKRRADEVRSRMAEACAAAGRDAGEVSLLPVTKTHPAAAADYVARYGLPAVGENRVQEGVDKRAQCAAALRWELIGHLQSNKAALAARHFDRVQSVDSPKLAARLGQAAAQEGRRLAVLLQINAGNDPAKFGAAPEEAEALAAAALAQPGLRVEGFMTIAPLSDDPSVAQRTFDNLRALRDRLQERLRVPLPELSMGMTGDFAAAIAAGSTQVRVGTALFGSR